MNEACVISFQVHRFLQDSSSLIGHGGQVTRTIIYEVAATNDEHHWDRKYGQHHQSSAFNVFISQTGYFV